MMERGRLAFQHIECAGGQMADLLFLRDGNEHLFLYEGKISHRVIDAVGTLFNNRIQRLRDGIRQLFKLSKSDNPFWLKFGGRPTRKLALRDLCCTNEFNCQGLAV